MAYSWQHYRLVFPIYVDFLETLNDVILEEKNSIMLVVSYFRMDGI